MAALDGTLGVVFPDGNIQTYAQSPVRQTVVNGPVDANGQSAFGGVTGATTVTAAGTLYLSAANGMTNRNSNALVNPSWTGLSTNGTMYLYATVNVDGSCTLGSTTLLPTYQWGGTFSTTAGQYTYNIQQMQMQAGSGTTAAQSYTVFVGEVTVASNLVSAIVWYALMGRYSRTTATLPTASTAISQNHYVGVINPARRLLVTCLTAENGNVVGDALEEVGQYNGTALYPVPNWTSRLSGGFTLVSGYTLATYVRSSGSTVTPTLANWSYTLEFKRSWGGS